MLAMGSIDYWDRSNLNLNDALNAEIWRESPNVQRKIQPPTELERPGSVGAQQAMLEGDNASLILPWVPDLVGKRVGGRESVLVIGPHYSGFIREYSGRREKMTLDEYIGATSSKEFQELFLDKVVRFDEVYYRGLEKLLHGLVGPEQVAVLDLCRASFVRRGSGASSRRDEAAERVVHDGWQAYTRYVENDDPKKWIFRRIKESNARVIVAVGTIAEHGLLRLLAGEGAIVTDFRSGHRLRLQHTGSSWTSRLADPARRMRYWYTRRSWWQTHVAGRKVLVLPVLQPLKAEGCDPHYQETRITLSCALEAACGRTQGTNSALYLRRYRPIQTNNARSEFLVAEDLVTGRNVWLRCRDLPARTSVRVIDREVQMLSLLNRPEFLLCADYGREAAKEIAVYEYHPDARLLSEVLSAPRDSEQPLAGPEASFAAQLPFLRSLAEAVNAMHSQGIVHGDIDERAVWAWPIGGVWIAKLARLDAAASNAVNPSGPCGTLAEDVQRLVRLVRLLLEKTVEHDRDQSWQHVNAVAGRISNGESLDAGSLLDAICKPNVCFEDRLNGYRESTRRSASEPARAEGAAELVKAALNDGRVEDLPTDLCADIAGSFPKLLEKMALSLTRGRDSEKRRVLIEEIVKVLTTSGDIDSIHESTCSRLLEWRPPELDVGLLNGIHEYGILFVDAHPSGAMENALADRCRWAFSRRETSPEKKRWWVDELRRWNSTAADELESEHKEDLPASHRPRRRECSPDLKIPTKIHHLEVEKFKMLAMRVFAQFDFVWRFRPVGHTDPKPSIRQPRAQEKLIEVILGQEYTQNKKGLRVIVGFAPEASCEQLRAAYGLLSERKQIFGL